MATRYDAGRSLGAKAGLSWGNSVFKFQRLTKVAGLDMDKEIERVKDKTGEYLKRRAEAGTPIKTGKARASWAKSTKKSGKKRVVEVFNTARTPKGLYYLNFVERGTVRIAPRRFFARAIAEAKSYEQKELEKVNRKIARRFNRG